MQSDGNTTSLMEIESGKFNSISVDNTLNKQDTTKEILRRYAEEEIRCVSNEEIDISSDNAKLCIDRLVEMPYRIEVYIGKMIKEFATNSEAIDTAILRNVLIDGMYRVAIGASSPKSECEKSVATYKELRKSIPECSTRNGKAYPKNVGHIIKVMAEKELRAIIADAVHSIMTIGLAGDNLKEIENRKLAFANNNSFLISSYKGLCESSRSIINYNLGLQYVIYRVICTNLINTSKNHKRATNEPNPQITSAKKWKDMAGRDVADVHEMICSPANEGYKMSRIPKLFRYVIRDMKMRYQHSTAYEIGIDRIYKYSSSPIQEITERLGQFETKRKMKDEHEIVNLVSDTVFKIIYDTANGNSASVKVEDVKLLDDDTVVNNLIATSNVLEMVVNAISFSEFILGTKYEVLRKNDYKKLVNDMLPHREAMARMVIEDVFLELIMIAKMKRGGNFANSVANSKTLPRMIRFVAPARLKLFGSETFRRIHKRSLYAKPIREGGIHYNDLSVIDPNSIEATKIVVKSWEGIRKYLKTMQALYDMRIGMDFEFEQEEDADKDRFKAVYISNLASCSKTPNDIKDVKETLAGKPTRKGKGLDEGLDDIFREVSKCHTLMKKTKLADKTSMREVIVDRLNVMVHDKIETSAYSPNPLFKVVFAEYSDAKEQDEQKMKSGTGKRKGKEFGTFVLK